MMAAQKRAPPKGKEKSKKADSPKKGGQSSKAGPSRASEIIYPGGLPPIPVDLVQADKIKRFKVSSNFSSSWRLFEINTDFNSNSRRC